MHTEVSSKITHCQLEDVLRYLDGEMSLDEECIFEEHTAQCRECHSELNEQKKMLSALDFAFEDDFSIEPPKDFAKIVAAKAESSVNGMRHPKERSLSLLFCLFMVLIVIAGLGIGIDGFFSTAGNFADQMYSVALLVGHLIYDIVLGIIIILKSLGHQAVFYSYSLGMLSLLLLFLILLTGYALRLTLVRK